jgi:hypothetical protein
MAACPRAQTSIFLSLKTPNMLAYTDYFISKNDEGFNKMKRYILTVVATLIASSLSLNTWATPPAKCPGVESLQSQTFATATCHMDDLCYVTQAVNKYDTKEYWGFAVRLESTSLESAIAAANKALPTLEYQSGPTEGREGSWKCSYGNSFGYTAEAIHTNDPEKLSELSK